MNSPATDDVLSQPAHRRGTTEFVRYLVAGGAITLATHGLFLLGLACGFTPTTSWAAAFVSGTIGGYFIHGRFVFRAPAQRHHWLSFPASYLLRFLLGEALLAGLIRIGVSDGWAGFITSLSMAPLGFILLRLVLRGRN